MATEEQQQPNISEPSEERKAELEAAYERQKDTDAPYKGVKIQTLGEIHWILDQRKWSGEYVLPEGMERVNLSGAIIERVNVSGLVWWEVNLSGAVFYSSNLSGVVLRYANMSSANLENANMRGSNLGKADLSGANLRSADLSAASLDGANLSGANLLFANLSNANLAYANLQGANIDEVKFNKTTGMQGIKLKNVDLTGVNWQPLSRFGDDFFWIWQQSYPGLSTLDLSALARTYRQLSIELRSQGMSDDADRYAYRAQVTQRGLYLRTWQISRYIFSHFLNLLAGYGYRPFRTLIAYLAVVFGFAFAYMHWGMIDSHLFTLHEAIIFSVTSFHGRGFFPGGLSLDDPVTTIAAIEAVIGLIIEVSFIATFTQRFFGK